MGIARQRLRSQRISSPIPASAAELVAHFGAMQAQDYPASLWAIGLRSGINSESAVEAAVVDRSVVRTWTLRGTLHFVAAADVRWMLSLVAPRSIAGNARRFRELGLDDAVAARSQDFFRSALAGGHQLARGALYRVLEQGGIATGEQRGYHLLWRAAQDGVICWGTREGKEHRFALLDDWVPPAAQISRDESIALLATRYFTSHGPATLADFVWWSGLFVSEAKRGIELSGSALMQRNVGERVYWTGSGRSPKTDSSPASAGIPEAKVFLLPAFDEYIVAYRDRSDVLDPAYARRVNAGGGMLKPLLVIDGEVAGVWARTQSKQRVTLTVTAFRKLSGPEERALEDRAEQYASFLGSKVELSVV